MNNGFEKHGISYLSPSSINMYADCAGAWCARYLFGAKFSFRVAAQVGVLTERVVEEVLLGRSFDDALERAHKIFNKDNALNTSEKDLNRIHDIKPMAELALGELKQYGEPELIHKLTGIEQQRIEIKCVGNGWEIPFIGYTDFEFPKHGILYDLKTTLRIPSIIPPSHQRQGAIYAKARSDYEVRFLYCSPKKSTVHVIENVDETLVEIKEITKRMEEFLQLDQEVIKKSVPINYASFYWYGDENIRKELYSV